MPTARELLLSAVEEKRPLVLLLGQDAWSDSSGGDSLLVSVLEKLGRSGEGERRWAEMLVEEPVPADHYSWLAERFERRVHPPFIEVLQYRAGDTDSAGLYARIGAPAALSEAERRKLADLLRNFFDVNGHTQLEGHHFLATLYRHLPASRPRIGSGLGAEARAAVQLLGLSSNERPKKKKDLR